VDGSYIYLIKGKNGEPKKGVLIDFEFFHKYYHSSQSKTLKTDKQGEINLGPLKNITYFNASPRTSRIIRSQRKSWVLPSATHLSYPSGQTLTLLSSETLRLPFKHKAIKPTNLSFLQFTQSSNQYRSNLFDLVKLEKLPRNSQGV